MTGSDSPSDSAWLRFEAKIDGFEQKWQLPDPPPRIADFLPPSPSPDRIELLQELIKVDLEYRWAQGQQTKIEDYLEEFPELRLRELSLDLILQEIRVREYHQATPTLDELESRFPGVSFDLPTLNLVGGRVRTADLGQNQSPPTHLGKVSDSTVPSSAQAARKRERGRVTGTDSVLEGITCLGRYQLRQQIGRGGFATVYRAYDEELQRDVAIKIPRADIMDDQEAAGRMLREAQSAARLRHPAIVPIYEVGRQGRQPFIVYAYVSGPTLNAVLNETRPAPEQAASWLATVADALEYAHQNGIVHRDVKPSNIIMAAGPGSSSDTGSGTMTPMLADFGLALQTGIGATVTQLGDILGTPAYMSPEQAAGRSHDVDGSCDVYSLGVILYQFLCGQLPFQGSGASVLHRVIHEEPLPPGRFRREVSEDLETICLKAMAKEPRHRYRSAAAFAEDLRRYLEHKPIHARRTSVLGRFVLWSKRKPALAATILVSTLIVLSVVTFSFRRIMQERDRYQVERDRAEANLYRALVSDATAQLRSRDTGWWWSAMDNLKEAALLDVDSSTGDPVALRELAIRCMGTGYPCMRVHREWKGHQNSISGVAFSPLGNLVASSSQDGTVRLWSMSTGHCVTVLTGILEPVSSVAFHPDGTSLAATFGEGRVRMWDLTPLKGSLQKTDFDLTSRDLEFGTGTLRRIAFSPDGRWLAAGCQNGDVRLAPLTGSGEQQTLQGHTGQVLDLAFSSQGQWLASSDRDQTIRLWELPSGQLRETWQVRNTANTLSFRENSRFLAWGELQSFGVAIRMIGNFNASIRSHLHTATVTQVQWIKQDMLASASADGTIKLGRNEAKGYQELAVAQGSYGEVTSLAASPDGRYLAAGYGDSAVRVWEVFEPPHRLVASGNYQRAVFLGPDRRLVDGSNQYDLTREMDSRPLHLAPSAIESIAVHPDGRQIAVTNGDGWIQTWDLESRQARNRWHAHEKSIRSLAAHPDGQKIASASLDGMVKIWRWDGELVEVQSCNLGELHQLTWSPDGRRLVVAGAEGAAVWEEEQEEKAWQVSSARHPLGRIACNDRLLATSEGGGMIRLWDLESRQLRKTLQHAALVTSMEFSPDGKKLASAALDYTLRVWDAEAGTEISRISFEGTAPHWLTWHAQGNHLLTCEEWPGRPELWDIRTGSRWAIHGPSYGRTGQFLDQGRRLLLGTDFGSVRLFDVREPASQPPDHEAKSDASDNQLGIEPGPIIVPGGHWDRVWGVAASPDGRYFATAAHDRVVRLFDAQTRELLRTMEGHSDAVWSIAFSPDSKFLSSASVNGERQLGEIKIWEVATGREVFQLDGHTRLVTTVDYHPNGRWLATSSLDGTVNLWDLTRRKLSRQLYRFHRSVYSLSFHPNGRWLAAGSLDGRIALWDVTSVVVDPSPGSQDVTAETQDSDLALSELASMDPHRWLTGHQSGVYSVGWSPDGEYLASGSEEGVLILWDGSSFERIVKLQGDTHQIRHVAFSRDGQLLAGAGYASPVIVWDLERVRKELRGMKLDW